MLNDSKIKVLNDSKIKIANNSKIKVTEKELKKEFPFKMGADPEFCILMQNNNMSAVETVPYLIDKKYKKENLGYNIPGKGNIGWDACDSTGEIRPLPSNKPEELINNIRGLFETIVQKTQIFSLSTLSKSNVVGGHIHIEINQALADKMKRIHRIMSTFYLPILMGENTLNVKDRLHHNYGHISDYRVQNINNTLATYEFRAPTAEWLTTPKLAQATLAYLGVVFHETITNPKSLNKLKSILFTTTDQSIKVQELTVTKFAPLLKSMTKIIRQAVRTFELYPNFQEEIEYIFNFDRVLKDKAKVNYNIITGWEMEKIAPHINKRTILSDKAVKERSLTQDIEEILEFIPIRHSQDLNMLYFATALKQRILVFNWRLKNNYYFFGLRNNIDHPIVAALKDSLSPNNNNTILNNIQFLTGQEQIKYRDDQVACLNLMVRIFNRTGNLHSTPNTLSIAFGIPYKDRINLNIKNFIRLIYEIEHDKFEPVILTSATPNLFDKDGDKIPGKLAAILNQSRPENQNRNTEGLFNRTQTPPNNEGNSENPEEPEQLEDDMGDLYENNNENENPDEDEVPERNTPTGPSRPSTSITI